MTPDDQKSKAELIRELRRVRRKLGHAQQENRHVRQSAEAQKYAELIIQNSPAILFRRLAAEALEDRKMVYVSPNISRFGYAAEDFLNNRIMFGDIVYKGDIERIRKEIDQHVRDHQSNYTQFYRIVTRDGEVRWIEDRTSVVEDPDSGQKYHQGIVIDIHRRKVAEEKLRRSEEKYRRIVETTTEGFLLMDKSLAITDLNQSFCRMTGYSQEELVGKSLLDLLDEEKRAYLSANREGFANQSAYEFESNLRHRSGNRLPVLFHGNRLHDDGGKTIGNMMFVTDMSEHKKALLLAAEVQKSMLPGAAPPRKGLDIAAKNIPCDEIGGDYFDFLSPSQDPQAALTVVVGDISGHGVDAALLMTTARAFLRMRASQPGKISDIVAAMNRQLTGDVSDTGKFMTLFCLTIDTDRRNIQWIRAGHEPGWHYDPVADRFTELRGSGMVLGVDESYDFRSNHRSNLNKDHILIIATDGLWEGHNRAGEMFGKERLRNVIRRNAADSAQTILNAVFDAHMEFTRDSHPEDDLTLVVVKITS